MMKKYYGNLRLRFIEKGGALNGDNIYCIRIPPPCKYHVAVIIRNICKSMNIRMIVLYNYIKYFFP